MPPRGSKCARVSGSKAVPALEKDRRSSREPKSFEENDKEKQKQEKRQQDHQQEQEQRQQQQNSVQESAEKKKASIMTMKRRKRKKRKRKPGRAKTTPETDAEAAVAAAAMVVAAREGRSWLGARLRQPLESTDGGLEQPRENGTLLQLRCTQSPHRELLPKTENLSSSACSSRSSSSSTSSYSRSSSVSSNEESSPSSKTSESTRKRLLGRDRKREEKRRRGDRECAPEETKKQEGKEDTVTEKEEVQEEEDEVQEEEEERSVGELQTRSAPPILSTPIPPPAPSTSSTTTQAAPSLSPSSSPSTSSEPLAASSPFSSSGRADSTNGISGLRSTSTTINTNTTTTSSSSTSTASSSSSSSPLENIRSALECYDRSRIYLAHVSFLDWRDVPGRRREHPEDHRNLHGATSRSSERSSGERVWVVGAADHDGHHRTRLLVAGRHWRPRCLSRVNMLSQPVVYAGGGRGSLTADLFLWWFHREFAVTAMAMHPDGAVLVAESADYLPPEGDCVAADGLVRLFVVPKDCLETRIVVRELRIRLAIGALTRVYHGVYRSKLSTIERDNDRLETYLRRFTLKEAFADLHRAWLSVRSETFARSWALPREREDIEVRTGRSNFPGATSIHRSIVATADREEDRMLLDELRGLAGELGLKVGDDELARWIVDGEERTSNRFENVDLEDQPRLIKIESEHKSNYDQEGEYEQLEDDEEEEEDSPTAEETVGLLTRVLTWMEREPLDPALLLAVRSMRDIAAIMASKMGLAGTHPSGLPFFCPNGDHLTQPPPAHMGIPPYGALDAGKAAAAAGLTRAPMYPFSTGQYPYPMLSPEMTQVAASWHTPSMYPISPASAGFRSPYPTSLPITSSSLPSDLYRFSPTGLMPPHHGLGPHAHALASHALVSSAPKTDHSTLDHNHSRTYKFLHISQICGASTDRFGERSKIINYSPDKMKKSRSRIVDTTPSITLSRETSTVAEEEETSDSL
ncbi:hypothetical protein KPH14_003522 [Odynerus spinipes]|uniref:DDE-1 domain-containing protein n=1 Tax=Odynerus spinipes TaxID=1348599 RepID=A0AAD9VKU6_9HYME|nr:hypothetical protein KPH14_003522 [Odynerus spinipes]